MTARFARLRLQSLIQNLCLVFAFLTFPSAAVYASCMGTTWNLGAGGNFNVAGNWNPATVPNSSGTNVCIVDGTSAVALTAFGPTIGNLTLNTGNSLNISNNGNLTVAGTSINLNGGASGVGGVLMVSGGGGFNGALTLTNANVSLSGGTLTLAQIDTNGSTVVSGTGVNLANSGTIQGAGNLGNGSTLQITNTGTITGNSSLGIGVLALNAQGGVVNTGGLLTASNNGTLSIVGTTVNNSGGQVTVGATGTTNINNSTIQGGTLSSAGGTLQSTGTGTIIDGSTHGAVTIASGTFVAAGNNNNSTFEGTITNNSNIKMSGGGGVNGTVTISGTVTLNGNGSGTLTMSQADFNGNTIINGNNATLNNVNNLIHGAGFIGNGNNLAIINTGTIAADTSAGIAEIDLRATGGVTNANGLLTASNGGTMNIDGITVNNANGLISVGSTGITNIENSTVQGGMLKSGGGTLQSIGTGTLDGSTQGAITISTGTTYVAGANSNATNVLGTITNNGNIQINGGGGFNGVVTLTGATMLNGGGTVTMSRIDSNGINEIVGGGFTLTNVNNTIQGAGVIGNSSLTVINGGTITANVAGSSVGGQLLLNASGGIINSNGSTGGLLAAANGGTLIINSNVANGGGQITVQDAISAIQTDGTITGGTLNNKFGGFMGPAAGVTATLDGSTAAGAVTLSTGSTFTVANSATEIVTGTITNQGNIKMMGGAGFNGFLSLGGDVTLNGGGTITMSRVDTNGTTVISGNHNLTNVNNTIGGAGVIGNGGGLVIINGGTITANTAAGTGQLILNGSGITNSNGATGGLLAAANGGTLLINTNVSNAGGNITVQDGSSAIQTNATITGGTLNNKFGGFMGPGNGNAATLDGSTSAGAVTISSGSVFTAGQNNSQTTLLGTITNHGNILMSGGAGVNGFLTVTGTVTLNGGGMFTMSQVDTNGNTLLEGTGTLQNIDNTIRGAGQLGNGTNMSLINSGTISANSSLGIGALHVDMQGGVTNTNLMTAVTGGTLLIDGTTVNNAGGRITVGDATGTVDVRFSTIQGGTLSNAGGTMQSIGTSTLDGSTAAGAVTISSGTYIAGGNNNQTDVLGTIHNMGNIQLSGGGGVNGAMILTNNLTLDGGGTVSLTRVDTNGTTHIFAGASGLTLTNVNNTFQGAGNVGESSMAVVNDGIFLANINGPTGSTASTLVLNATGVSNLGTFQASNGGTLLVTAPLTTTLTNGGFNSGTITGNYGVDGSAGHVSTLQINSLGTAGGEITKIGDGITLSSVTLNGTNANTQFVDASGLNALNLKSVSANASLNLGAGIQLSSTQGSFTVNGDVNIMGSGSSLSVNGPYTQSGAGSLTNVNSGASLSATSVTINGGVLQGNNGTITSPNSTIASTGSTMATLLPGTPGMPGTITFNGNLTISGGINQGFLTETINGGAAGQFGVTHVSGTLGIGGLTPNYLNIAQAPTYNPPVGTALTIMTAGSAVTGPSGLAAGTFGGGLEQWNVVNNLGGNNVTLVAGTAGGTDIISTATSSGSWGAPGNWNTNVPVTTAVGTVPNNHMVNGVNFGYTAVINSAGITMAQNSGAVTINNLNVTVGNLLVTGGATLTVNNNSNLAGNIEVDSGSKLAAGTLTQFSSNALGGNILLDSGGTFQANLTGLNTLSGNLTLKGISVASGLTDGANDVFNGVTNVSSTGDLTITGGRNATDTAAAGLTVNGTLEIDSSSSMSLRSAILAANEATTVNGTLSTTNGSITLTGGTLSGNGVISTQNGAGTSGLFVQGSGVLQPGTGSTPGSLSINNGGGFGGNLFIGSVTNPGGTLFEILNGTTAGQFNFINAAGGITLGNGSILDLQIGSGFNLGIGNEITIATGSSLSGSFNTIQNPFFNSGTEKLVELNSGGNLELVAQASSEIQSTWTGPSNNWTNTAAWSNTPNIAAFPNNGGAGNFAVTLNSSGNTMTLNVSSSPNTITVDSLNIQAGTLQVAGPTTSLTINGALSNSDTFNAGNGAIVTAGSLTNVTGTTLTGGNWSFTSGGGTVGKLVVNGLNITTIGAGATVTLNGGGTASGFSNGSTDALANLNTINGKLGVSNGTNFTTSGDLTNNGTLNIGAGSGGGTVNVGASGANNFTNHGTTLLVAGTLNANNVTDTGSTHVFSGGSTLSATGTYAESGTMTVDNGGKVVVGTYNNSGTTTVNGILQAANYNDNTANANTTIGNGGLVFASGTYTENGGFTDIQTGAELTAATVNLEAGKIQVDGQLDPASIDVFAGTELFGLGKIIGPVDNSGTVFAGDDASHLGKLTLNGNLTDESGSKMIEDIISASNLSLLQINGSLTDKTGAEIDINELGYTPNFGDLLTIMDYTGTLTGQNFTLGGAFASDFNLLYDTGHNAIELQFNQGGGGPPSVPEPKFLLLDLALAGALLAWKTRRSKAASR